LFDEKANKLLIVAFTLTVSEIPVIQILYLRSNSMVSKIFKNMVTLLNWDPIAITITSLPSMGKALML